MARLNGGALGAIAYSGLLFIAGYLTAELFAAGRSVSAEEAAKRLAVHVQEARAFGLACPAKREPRECEGLCRGLFDQPEAWGVCMRAVIDPALVGAGPDPAPELAGGPFPDECEGLPPEVICGEGEQ